MALRAASIDMVTTSSSSPLTAFSSMGVPPATEEMSTAFSPSSPSEPRLAVLWVGILYAPLHHSLLPHAVAMTFGGTLVGLAHLANLRLNHGHVHDATCAHGH